MSLLFYIFCYVIQIDCQTAETTVGSLRIQVYKEIDDVQEDSVYLTEASLLTVKENPYKALQIRLGQGLWNTSHTFNFLPIKEVGLGRDELEYNWVLFYVSM